MGVAAGLVGVVGAIRATAAVGYSLGDIMSGAAIVATWRALVPSSTQAVSRHVETSVDQVGMWDVSFSYPNSSSPALVDVSLEAQRGQMVGLVGVNGAGKTTTVGVLMGLLAPSHGHVVVNGSDVTGDPLTDRLASFGALSQEFGRYEFRVRDSVRIGRPDGRATDAEIWEALRAARIADAVEAMPQGLDTQLGEQFGGVGLSGGQWQRLALARIYVRGAGVWVLDEPTSAIDAETEEQIFTELATTRAGRITIVVSHRAWTLKSMDRIYVFSQGRVVESGTYGELIEAQGTFARLFKDQISAAAPPSEDAPGTRTQPDAREGDSHDEP